MGRNRCDPGQRAQEFGPVKKSLPSMDWRERPGLDRLLAALDADEDMARSVGGAVRDTLLGFPVADVDIAPRHLPRNVMERLAAAGLKAVPTGIDHGTLTAVLAWWPVQIISEERRVGHEGVSTG